MEGVLRAGCFSGLPRHAPAARSSLAPGLPATAAPQLAGRDAARVKRRPEHIGGACPLLASGRQNGTRYRCQALTQFTESDPQLSTLFAANSCQLTECGSPPSAADVQEVLPHLTPKQLADAVWCFAQHEVKPTQELMDAVAQEIHSKLGQFRAQDLSNTLWAFAMLKYQPTEEWWQDFERQVYGALTDLTDRQLANLLWAFAVLERRSEPAACAPASAASASTAAPDASASASASAGGSPHGAAAALAVSGGRRGWVLDPLLAHSCANGFSGFSSGSLHLLMWSLGRLHHAPSQAWLQGFLPAAAEHFFRFSPTELSNIVWALAKLGAELPAPWLDKLLLVAQWRFPSFPARLLSIVAWSTATLNHRPQPEWLMCFEEQIRSKFLDFTGHELACVAWSLRRFGYSTRNNAVFYMLQKQQRFLGQDYEILSNPKLLRQLVGLRSGAGEGEGDAAAEDCGGARGTTGPGSGSSS